MKGLTRQMHSDRQKLRRSYLALHLLPAGDLRRSASQKEKLAVIGATQYSYCKAKRNLSEEV